MCAPLSQRGLHLWRGRGFVSGGGGLVPKGDTAWGMGARGRYYRGRAGLWRVQRRSRPSWGWLCLLRGGWARAWLLPGTGKGPPGGGGGPRGRPPGPRGGGGTPLPHCTDSNPKAFPHPNTSPNHIPDRQKPPPPTAFTSPVTALQPLWDCPDGMLPLQAKPWASHDDPSRVAEA